MTSEERPGPGGDRGFVVIDRRGAAEEEHGEADSGGPAEAAAEAGAGALGKEESRPLPPTDFSTLVVSLANAAFYHLGLVPNRESAEPGPPKSLELARWNIDTLEVLQGKTRGNLEAEEAKLLESLLFELRMRFVDAAKPSGR